MRAQAGLSVSRFCALIGMSRSTWHRRSRRSASAGKGPWPAPVRDAIEDLAADYALHWPAWGHRKLHALMAFDGVEASEATVKRALRRRGLLQPAGGVARERRALAQARREAFLEVPRRRNRVWQTDFSELETAGGGTWQMSGVVDYVGKVCLACPVTATKTWRDAVAALEDARSAAHDLLGRSLLDDITDPATGEVVPVIVVTDNGSAYRAAGFARYIASRPELRHVRTRVKSPESNGVVERFFGAIKVEQLWRELPDDGPTMAAAVAAYRELYNAGRPHEALGQRFPLAAYTAPLTRPHAPFPTRQTVSFP
jgi:putative transposase